METKKRKYNEISKHNLNIKKIDYLPCDICNRNVYHYRLCTSPYVYCSYDCFSILVLSFKNDYLDVKTWVDMKRTKSEEDFTGLDFDKR